MNRGSFVELAADVCLSVASMRPRFMNRGSLSLVLRLPAGRAASMRPRFMNRGSPEFFAQATVTALTSFNEAPIHESGKCAREGS